MKNFVWVLLGFIALQSCKKHDDTPYTSPAIGNLMILKVDYLTHKFEGGHVFSFSPFSYVDSIPIKLDYKSPSDFGGVTLLYAPGNDTILSGSLVWMGKGQLHYPVIEPAKMFSTINTTLAAPDSAKIQFVNHMISPYVKSVSGSELWPAVSNLAATQDFMNADVKVGLFLYQPSVGGGDPADWDWFWIFYKRNMPLD